MLSYVYMQSVASFDLGFFLPLLPHRIVIHVRYFLLLRKNEFFFFFQVHHTTSISRPMLQYRVIPKKIDSVQIRSQIV